MCTAPSDMIGDNLNAVSNDTRELILDCQIAMALGEGLDDFRRTTVDSTAVAGEAQRLHGAYLAADLAPGRRAQAARVWSLFGGDVADACRVMGYCEARVFQQRRTPSREKILSLADRTAALIVKGDREPLVGYKPQLARSGNGLVTALLVPEGNAADAPQLSLLVQATQRRTGVGLDGVSTDDGYTSAEGRNALLLMDIGVVSFSGSKGKHLIPEEDSFGS